MKHLHGTLRSASFIVAVFGTCMILSVLGGTYLISTHLQSNCENVHSLYRSINRILQESDGRIMHSTAWTASQKREYLKGNQKNKVILRQGDCH